MQLYPTRTSVRERCAMHGDLTEIWIDQIYAGSADTGRDTQMQSSYHLRVLFWPGTALTVT
ncbi:hypothetical protein KFU94_68785 [Chloroflexi bacterium TSY]|nr:hypothetical protein [Chloroflexi bacterium TSY]